MNTTQQVHFNTKIIRKGDRYGLNDVLTHDDDANLGPMVEFLGASAYYH